MTSAHAPAEQTTGPDDAGADDGVLPITRWVARIIIPFLAAAFLALYGAPGRTTELFAWTIRPDITPIIMGAGYGAGVYFFYKVSTVERWHEVASVFIGITAFTWFMAIATGLHWRNFNHEHPTFFLWVVLYAVTPLVIPSIWALNRRTDTGHPGTGAIRMPRGVRVIGGAVGVGITVAAVVQFVAPGIMIDAWPWAVSAFTARILAGWFGLLGVVNAATILDPRWSAARILVKSQLLGFSLVLVGVARSWRDFDPTNPLTGIVVGGMALYLAAIAGLYAWMETRKGRA